jgi:plastocyanin
MRTLLALVISAALVGSFAVAVAGASGGSSPAAVAKTRTVPVGDIYFVKDDGRRNTVTVRRGDTVRFRWVGRLDHNVVATGANRSRFRSIPTRSRGSVRRRFNRRGTYTLYCTLHGAAQQSMRVRVR